MPRGQATRDRRGTKLCAMKSTRSVIAYVLLVAASAGLAVSGASIAQAAPSDERPSLNRGWHSPAGDKAPARLGLQD